jgi:hypothetical protein
MAANGDTLGRGTPQARGRAGPGPAGRATGVVGNAGLRSFGIAGRREALRRPVAAPEKRT